MTAVTFRQDSWQACARLLIICLVSCALVFSSIQPAEARSRGRNVAIGVGAAIVGAIILNEAVNAEARRKNRGSLAKSERRRHQDNYARSKTKTNKSRNVVRKTKPTEERRTVEKTPVQKNEDATSDVETGAIGDDTPSDQAKATATFPLVFYDKVLLQRLGIVIGKSGPDQPEIKHYQSKCYKKWPPDDLGTPDELYDISLSDDFVLKFAKRGFSLNSLCLALASGIKFDPETGKRLPTFILADRDRVKDKLDAWALTSEIPLDLPDCFRFGRPYSDCKFNYDPKDTKNREKLSSSVTKRFAELGRKIDIRVANAKAAGKWSKTCAEVEMHDGDEELLQDCKLEKDRDGWLQNDGIISNNINQDKDPESGQGWEKQRMIDVSPVFPAGYGYALYAPTGVGGPPPTEAAERDDSQDPTKVQSEATVPGIIAMIASWWN